VSKHWRPERNVVPGPWARPDAYAPSGRGGGSGIKWLLLALLAAVFVGLATGYLLSRNGGADEAKPDSPIEWNAVQAVPTRPLEPDEVEWEKRAQDGHSPSTSPGRTEAVTASFSYCKWGGGTNCVVDGDTFYINGDKVRIAGIDAPETHPPRCDDEAKLGEEATGKLHELLNSGEVTMSSIDRDRDVYGRLLRNVAVNGQDVGEAMIAAGVAREYGSGRRSWC
jgi:micrococcal nuclease